MLNHDLLFSVPCCLFLNGLIKETTCNVIVDHLHTRVTPTHQYTSHVKVRGTSLKMDVMEPSMMYEMNCTEKERSLIRTTENLLWCVFVLIIFIPDQGDGGFSCTLSKFPDARFHLKNHNHM